LLFSELELIDEIPLSRVAQHDEPCCTDAVSILFARLRHVPDVGARVAAVPVLIEWGPTRWPVWWCDLVQPQEIVGDCGVHADVVSRLLNGAGIKHARGRAALRPPPHVAAHWRSQWLSAECDDRWIRANVVHHEVLRIGDRWWDPTEARWFDGVGTQLVSGRVVAVREETGGWELAFGSAEAACAR
jgi:hypothetical protein